jgi:6-pyruvoyltetrahydropterin/6-carboxytetrahydropterin synthase
MSESYHVRLAKERFTFCAAHFITYDEDVCEPLHGHNYHVAVEISGPLLDENQYVVDFIAASNALQEITAALDHRMLLPLEHPTIRVTEQAGEVLVSHGKRRWIFPREDCVLLPLANTTAELLARHIANLLADSLAKRAGSRPERIQVAVDECDGQWGVYENRS